ncbi:MAG: hypothetical protein AB7Q17_10115 [Phycisphaerae bacterium]
MRPITLMGSFVFAALTSMASADPQLQTANWSGQTLAPHAVLYLDAAGNALGDWTPVGGGIAGLESDGVLVFDAAQIDPLSGAGQGGECVTGGTPDTRYWFGAGYNMFNGVEDFRVSPGAAGQPVDSLLSYMSWRPPVFGEHLFVIFQMFDSFDFACSPGSMPASGLLWQAVFDFGVVPPIGGYYILGTRLIDAPPSATFPADGDGAYRFVFAQAVDIGPPLTFTNPTSAGPMLWGFRDDPADASLCELRAGHPPDPNDPPSTTAWYDDAPADGILETHECRMLPLLSNISSAALCHFVNTETAWSMWARPGDPPCGGHVLGDANCDGAVNNFDIDAFVLALIDPAGYGLVFPTCDLACANDINGDGTVNNFDIDPFVVCMVNAGCPPGPPAPPPLPRKLLTWEPGGEYDQSTHDGDPMMPGIQPHHAALAAYNGDMPPIPRLVTTDEELAMLAMPFIDNDLPIEWGFACCFSGGFFDELNALGGTQTMTAACHFNRKARYPSAGGNGKDWAWTFIDELPPILNSGRRRAFKAATNDPFGPWPCPNPPRINEPIGFEQPSYRSTNGIDALISERILNGERVAVFIYAGGTPNRHDKEQAVAAVSRLVARGVPHNRIFVFYRQGKVAPAHPLRPFVNAGVDLRAAGKQPLVTVMNHLAQLADGQRPQAILFLAIGHAANSDPALGGGDATPREGGEDEPDDLPTPEDDGGNGDETQPPNFP